MALRAGGLQPVADSRDVVERVAFATDFLLHEVLSYQGAVRSHLRLHHQAAERRRATRAALRTHRPRPGPLADTLARTDAPTLARALAQLRRDLAVVMSAEALFTLTDLCELAPDDAIASAVATAKTLTQAVVEPSARSTADSHLSPGADTAAYTPQAANARGA